MASALAGVSISTLRVSEPFSFSWIEEICWSPNCGLKRTVQPGGAWATSEVGSGFVGFVFEIDGEFKGLPGGGAENGILAAHLDAAGFNFLGGHTKIDGFDVLRCAFAIFGRDFDRISCPAWCFQEFWL